MKASMVILAAAGLVAAQSSIPTCVYTCLPDAVGTTCSSDSDLSCICKNIETIMSNGAACFAKECSADDLKNSSSLIASVCGSVSSSGSASATASKTSSSGSDSASTSASASKTTGSSKTTSASSGSGATTPTSSSTKTGDDEDSSSATDASATNASASTSASASASASASDKGDAARPVVGAGLAMFAAFLAL